MLFNNGKKKNSDIYEQYTHHGTKVWCIKKLKGDYNNVCLCFRCKKFDLIRKDKSCSVSNMLYSISILHKIEIPVWECKDFEEK